MNALISTLVHLLHYVELGKAIIIQEKMSRYMEDGGLRQGVHLPPNKNIQSIFVCGTNPTEHLLNPCRRP